MIEYKPTIEAAEGSAESFVYTPGDGPHPGLLFYTDLFGIRPAAQGMAKRIAEAGYTVLMPNIFYRYGKLPLLDFEFQMGEERSMKALPALFGSLTSASMEKDAPYYVDAMLNRNDVSGDRIAVVGYCFSGAMALRTAAVMPDRVAAAASFHGGRLVTEDQDSPHTRIAKVKGELYFAHAVEDQTATPAQIATLEETLKSWGGTFQSEVYEGARHGWTVPGRDVYDEKQAERHYEKLFDLLKRTVG
ncbi:MAG TPA: dienelactone hydrolase family protein [Rhizomicrobium sp.]|jgi:carboxymethylenebutenolidase|nr:dienelactone hydrolase family protein [Rhizomicrobium sp.]